MKKKFNPIKTIATAAVIILALGFQACKKNDKIAVTGINIIPESVSLAPGGSIQLEAIIEPENATNKGVIWSSVNTDRATVTADGLVTVPTTASAGDFVVITANSADGGKLARCTVTVAVKSVALGAQVSRMRVGQTGSVTFPVTTIGITDGSPIGEVRFYSNEAGTNQMPALPPNTIVGKVSAVTGGTATVTIDYLTAPTVAGTAYIRVFIDGTLSNVRPLVVTAAVGRL